MNEKVYRKAAVSNPQALAIHELRYILENAQSQRTLELQIQLYHKE